MRIVSVTGSSSEARQQFSNITDTCRNTREFTHETQATVHIIHVTQNLIYFCENSTSYLFIITHLFNPLLLDQKMLSLLIKSTCLLNMNAVWTNDSVLSNIILTNNKWKQNRAFPLITKEILHSQVSINGVLMSMSCDLENLFSSSHSHNEYLWHWNPSNK